MARPRKYDEDERDPFRANIYFPDGLLTEMQKFIKGTKITFSGFVSQACREYLKKKIELRKIIEAKKRKL